jgi:hypothetical protein
MDYCFNNIIIIEIIKIIIDTIITMVNIVMAKDIIIITEINIIDCNYFILFYKTNLLIYLYVQ